MSQQNNLATEIILGIVAGLMAIAAPVLLYLGTINFSGALAVWGIAAGVVGVKLALNAPSPSQQAQLGTQQSQVLSQQQQLQQLVQYALTMLPGIVQSLQSPVASPQAQQTAQPSQPVMSVPVPVVPPTPDPVAMNTPAPQFKPPVPVAVEHPPIEPSQMVNTFPNLPAFGQQAQQ